MSYATFEYWVAALEVFLAMLGMGATLTVAEFRAIARRPQAVLLVLLVQYIVCPLWALGLSRWAGLPVGITMGLVVVASMPSGALSNIFAFLAKSNVPLSITATCASTLVCLFVTPFVLQFFLAEHLPADVEMPTGEILRQIIFCLLLPLAIGMWVHAYFPKMHHGFSRWCIRLSLVFLLILVVASLGSGRIDVMAYGLKIPALLVFFGLALIGPLNLFCVLIGFSKDDATTMAIETTIRNCNAALLMKATIFPATEGPVAKLGSEVLYVALFYGGASLFLGMLPILRRRVFGYGVDTND